MEKYLVTIEFRYTSKREYETGGNMHVTKTNTIGVFDDFETACKHGNTALEELEKQFKIHTYPQGHEAKRERFSKNGGPFNTPNNLITNLAYLKTPFQFFAKITKLKHDSMEDTISAIMQDIRQK